MKKLFALMLALCLLCSVAMAEDTLSWENVARPPLRSKANSTPLKRSP